MNLAYFHVLSLQLVAFLTRRIEEMKTEDLLASSQFEGAPPVLHVNEDDLSAGNAGGGEGDYRSTDE